MTNFKCLFGKIDRISRLASAFTPFSNWFANTALNRWLMDRFIGIDKRRQLPQFSRQTFSSWFAKRQHKHVGDKGQVLFFNDTFVEYNEPHIGMAAVLILENAGYEVLLAKQRGCCGRPLISKGFLKLAKARVRENIASLTPYAEQGIPIVGIEPSCMLTFKDDYLDLYDAPQVGMVADHVFMLEDFLLKEHQSGNLKMNFTGKEKQILVHGHCHQKALVGMAATLQILNMPPGYSATEINSGCCGMAGSFGYEKEHYEVSRQVGQERLFDVVDEAGPEVEIAAVGTSCRHQIADFTERKARHWTEIIVEALN